MMSARARFAVVTVATVFTMAVTASLGFWQLDRAGQIVSNLADLAKTIKAGQKVALTNPAGEVVATLDVNDVFAWPKLKYLRSVYLTERVDHPGADMVLRGDADKSHLIGGEIRVLPQPKNLKDLIALR